MIQAKYGNFDGNTWEEFCQICLKIKFESEGYQELPAWQGDMGIEGFTRSGKAFQCYCPDGDYNPTTLYEKQRDKITKDLNKLEVYKTELKEYLKDIEIKQWIFLSPIIKNKELVKHCQNKAYEYRVKQLDILSKQFDVLVYDEDYFAQYASVALMSNNQKIEINVNENNSNVDWKNANITLVDHAVAKHRKRILSSAQDIEGKINRLTENTIGDFLSEQLILKEFKSLNPNDYEMFIRIVGDCEKTVEEMCMTNDGNNNQLYERIKNELSKRLKEYFPHLGSLTLEKLTKGVIADWILRCPINFE